MMRKMPIMLLTAIFAFARVASSAEKIGDLAWNESNIKTLRAADNETVFRFSCEIDPECGDLTLSSVDYFEFHWYPAGDKKYELAIDSQNGPEVSWLEIYWQDAPRKFSSQTFEIEGDASEEWYFSPEFAGTKFADLSGDGKEELILFDTLEYDLPPSRRTNHVPGGAWPRVYRLRNGKYIEASRDFPSFYKNKILPQLDKAIVKARKDVKERAEGKTKPNPYMGPHDDYWQQPARYMAALIMCRDKILRFIGRDPTAGLAQAREWMNSPDPVLVNDGKSVFEDIGGRDKEVNAAKVAVERASEHWPNEPW